MIARPLSLEVYQAGETHQLGTPVGVYKRYTTLSGKICLVGITLLGFFLMLDILLMISAGAIANISAPLDFAQLIFATGGMLSWRWHEEIITPLHPKLSVSVYTGGLIYRKGRKVRVVHWEEIQSIQRQFKIYRRRKRIIDVRPAYLCKLTPEADLVLEMEITGVDEIGAYIEQELTKRLFPAILADYQAGEIVSFAGIDFEPQRINDYRTSVAWERVKRIEVGPEELVIEYSGRTAGQIKKPLKDIANYCVFEEFLKELCREKGIELAIDMQLETQDVPGVKRVRKPWQRRRQGKISWVALAFLVITVLANLALEAMVLHDTVNSEVLDQFPDQVFQVSGTPTVVIKADVVDTIFVTSEDGDTDKVFVSSFKKAVGIRNNLDDIQESAQQDGDVINLAWTEKQGIFLGVGAEKIDLFVNMPTNGNVRIENGSGEVNVDGISGEMHISTRSGHLSVGDVILQGHSLLQSTSGLINFCGSLDPQSSDLFQSQSGQINITLPDDASFILSSSTNPDAISNEFGITEAGVLPHAHLVVATNTGKIALYNEYAQANCS